MDKFEILKAKAKELGLSAEDVVRCFWRDKELSHEFLQNLLYGVELRKAERGDIKIKMFYYAEDETFSEKLIPYKRVSGVVGDVDKTGRHGLVALLHQKVLPWSSDELSVGLPNGLNGKENTRLIIEAALLQKQKVEAAEYCATYAYDGIQPGEAFLPLEETLSRFYRNFVFINTSLRQIDGADVFKTGYYWSCNEGNKLAQSPHFSSCYRHVWSSKACVHVVCPVIAF